MLDKAPKVLEGFAHRRRQRYGALICCSCLRQAPHLRSNAHTQAQHMRGETDVSGCASSKYACKQQF